MRAKLAEFEAILRELASSSSRPVFIAPAADVLAEEKPLTPVSIGVTRGVTQDPMKCRSTLLISSCGDKCSSHDTSGPTKITYMRSGISRRHHVFATPIAISLEAVATARVVTLTDENRVGKLMIVLGNSETSGQPALLGNRRGRS